MFIRTSRALLFLGLSLFSLLGPIYSAELVTVVVTLDDDPPYVSAPVILAKGDLFELEYVADPAARLLVKLNGKIEAMNCYNSAFAGSNIGVAKIAGPAEVQIESAGTVATYKVTRASTPVTTVPSTAVVIPENVTGDFQVILEASADLQTWTPVSPGTFSSTHPQRFFRTRIFKTP